MNKKPTVYIFRGAPASGKGTLIPQFCQLLPSPVALIEQDQFRWGLHLIGRQIPDITDEEHMFAWRNTLAMYEQYLKNSNYTIVIEGLFTWDDQDSSQGNTKELIELAERYGFAHESIVLKADKEELLRRNVARKYSVPAEEFEELYGNIYNKIDTSEIVIDTTDLNEAESLEKLKEALQL